MWRKILHGLGCLGYAGLLLVIFAAISYAAFSQFVRRGVTPTPELFGLDEEEALALLTDQGLRLAWSEEGDRYDDRVPDNHILMQEPSAGTLVKRGRAVTVTLSRGPRLIEVPQVTGVALQAAQITLHAAGLRPGRTLNVYGEGSAGTVVAQQPAAGSRVDHEAAVDLLLSQDDPNASYLMPDLVNQSYEDVRRFFESRGFLLGRISYETYDGITPGTVVRQYPLAGHPLRRGSVISLGVVKPRSTETVTTPTVAAPAAAAPTAAAPAAPQG